LKLNYNRLSGYTKSELWNYLHELGFKEKTLGSFHSVSKARLRDFLECICVKCHKLSEEPLPRRGTRSEPICIECQKKHLKEVLEHKSKNKS